MIKLKNGSIINPIGVPKERLRTTEERVMATDRERQIARDKKLDEAVEVIKKLNDQIQELKESVDELKKSKGKKTGGR